MAYVKRISIKSTISNSLDYATDEKNKILINDIEKIINYIKQEHKVAYKSGINCSSNSKVAYKQMQDIKNKFNKTCGVLGYHYIQSFKPNETTAKKAHEIGLEFAKKAFSNHQAIVCTHVDKNHIHNHIVFNSVNMETGNKFVSSNKSLYYARDISDEIIKKYNLSIIVPNEKKNLEYEKKYNDEKYKARFEMKKQIIKTDILRNIQKSNLYVEFLKNLKSDDYLIKDGKYLSIKPKNYIKFMRTKSLGEEFTKEKIVSLIDDKSKLSNLIIENNFATSFLRNMAFKKNVKIESEIINNFFILRKKYNIKNGNDLNSTISNLRNDIQHKRNIILRYYNQKMSLNELITEVNFYRENIKNCKMSKEEKVYFKEIENRFDKNNINLKEMDKLKDNLIFRLDENNINTNIKMSEIELLEEDLKTCIHLKAETLQNQELSEVQNEYDIEREIKVPYNKENQQLEQEDMDLEI